MKRWIVRALQAICERTHCVMHRRPFLWLGVCPFAKWSLRLNDRWGLDEWSPPKGDKR